MLASARRDVGLITTKTAFRGYGGVGCRTYRARAAWGPTSMPLAMLLPELRGLVLDILTVKQLVALRGTCREFCAAARTALDKPRFQERKEVAKLGTLLLEANGELRVGGTEIARRVYHAVRLQQVLFHHSLDVQSRQSYRHRPCQLQVH